MTLFFLVVGLEAKRELDVGELRERRRLAVPVVAALGGMLVPACDLRRDQRGRVGRPRLGCDDVDRHRVRARRARAADTARRHEAAGVPADARGRRRRVRAARDRDRVHDACLADGARNRDRAVRRAALRSAMRRSGGGRSSVLVAVGMWVALFESGIDPVISGLAVGLATSAYPPSREDLERATLLARSFREQPTPELARSARQSLIVGDLAERAPPVRAAPVDRLRGRAAVRARERRRAHLRRGLLEDAVGSPDHDRDPRRLRDRQADRHPVRLLARHAAVAGRPALAAQPRRCVAAGGAFAGVGFTVSLLISEPRLQRRRARRGEARRARLGGAWRRSSAGRVLRVRQAAAGERARAPDRAAPPRTSSTSPRTSTPSATTSAAPTTRSSRSSSTATSSAPTAAAPRR